MRGRDVGGEGGDVVQAGDVEGGGGDFVVAVFLDELVEFLFPTPRGDHVGAIFDELLGQGFSDSWVGGLV